MHTGQRLLPLVLLSALTAACGGSPTDTCKISASITPSSATADHNAAAPGNQVQFSLSSAVTGTCPMTPDSVGLWSTSDPSNTAISNLILTEGQATCLHATPTAATISNSGTVRGHPFPSATLACK